VTELVYQRDKFGDRVSHGGGSRRKSDVFVCLQKWKCC